MTYELQLNLQQRAALRIAILLWKNEEVKKKTEAFFESCIETEFDDVRTEWRKLTKTVVDEWDKELLPDHLKVQLVHIIKMISETIFNWFQYIRYEYGAKEALTCMEKLHWTPYGTIDEIKIFNEFWLDNPDIDTIKLYNFACCHILEEHIHNLWDEMPVTVQKVCTKKIYQRFDQHMLAYWKHSRDDNLPNMMEQFQSAAVSHDLERRQFDIIYDLNSFLEENMLRLSVHQGLFTAVKYFWDRITEEERNNNILKCIRLALIRFHSYKNYEEGTSKHKKSQYVEICMFLMNQMSENHKEAFFNEKLGLDELNAFYMEKQDIKNMILELLLFTWPWQELFMPVLKDILRCQNENSDIIFEFLDEITEKMAIDHNLDYPMEISKWQPLLYETWWTIPASIKQKIGQHDQVYSFIRYLIEVWDMKSLRLILNDPAISASRNKLIASGYISYEKLIVDDQFERLDQFIEEFLRSEEEKKQFKQKLNVWSELIERNRFDLTDKLLDWICSTPDERQFVKKSIDHVNICGTLISGCSNESDYDLLDKFLDWKLDTDEEKSNCKNCYRNDEFLITQILEMWIMNEKDTQVAAKESSLLLRWFFESDDDIARFKARMVMKLKDDESMIHCLAGLKMIGSLHDFLHWCDFQSTLNFI